MKNVTVVLGLLFVLVFNAFPQGAPEEICVTLGENRNVLPMGFLKNRGSGNTPKEIPVVVHIVYTDSIENTYVPEEAIQPAIDQLNVDFIGTGISFNLVGYDYTDLTTYIWHEAYVNGPVCFPTYQTQATMLSNDIAWDISEYCNIYVIPKMCSSILGYAYVGFGPNNADDGVWVLTKTFGVGEWPHLNPAYNENETLTHELGHYCGLFHTFNLNPGQCGAHDPDIPCEYEGDYVCDTPPTKPSSGCPGTPGFYCPLAIYDGAFFNAQNHMDYGKQACRDEFTQGQIDRMHAMLEYQRYELYSDDTVDPFCPGDFNGDGIIGTTDLLVVLANWGCVGCGPELGDVDLNYIIGTSDLNWILANWQEECGDGIGLFNGDKSPKPDPIPMNKMLAVLREVSEVNYVRVYTITGRLVHSTNILTGLDVSPGLYIVEITFKNGVRSVFKSNIN
jgi:hypothetical protein